MLMEEPSMQLSGSPRTLARIGVVAAFALVGSVLISTTTLAAGGHDRFHASASDEQGEAGELAQMHDLNSFDANAAANPVTGSYGLFSQCRFEPLASAVYAPFAANEHDAISDPNWPDTLNFFADGTSCYNPQNEQNIVINPTNRNNLVTSSNDYRYGFGVCFAYVSMDAGATWKNVVMPGWTGLTGAKGQFVKTGCGGDPVMAFGPHGELYYAGLTYNLDKFPRQMSGVAVSKSLDGGLHWSPPVMVSYNATGNFFYDKEWISVSNDGTVNLTWTNFYQGPRGLGYIKSPIVMSQSRNGGKSWSSMKTISDAAHPYNQGSYSAMAPDGKLYVIWEATSPSSGYTTDAIGLAVSSDGGRHFGATQEVARVYDDLDCYPIQLPGGQNRQTLSGEQFRLPVMPQLAIDPTSGKMAITWSDDQGAGSCGNGGTSFSGTTSNQVKVATSDNGSSWSVQTITSGAPDKFFATAGYNAGVLAIGYYTREFATTPNDPLCEAKVRDATTADIQVLNSGQNVCLDWAVQTSSNGGASWSGPIRISSQSSNPYDLFSGAFIGDYEGTAVDDQGKVYTVWTDFRGNPGVTNANQDTLVGTIPAP
jgi:hypothetical protein